LLAEKASTAADVFFKVCVRALDYCPPVDITFGDFLRAVVTSDFDLHPDDSVGLRDAFMQAFRVRGIVPEGSAFFSDVAIAWPSAGNDFPLVDGLVFGDPSGLTREQQDACKAALQAYVDNPAHRVLLGFDPEVPITIPSFHPVFRINQDGSLRTDMVVEVLQQVQAPFDPDNPNLGTFPLRGGATIILSKPPLSDLRLRESRGAPMDYGVVRFVIDKHLHGEVDSKRADRQRAQFERLGLVAGTDPNRFQIDFALTHGGL
jgi:hypothetical protein